MKKYVTIAPRSNHYIYKIGFGTYDILKSGLQEDKIHELLSDFLDMGGNVIDTSLNDIGFRGRDVEEAQKLIGRWISNCKRRQVIYLISKSSCLLSKDKSVEEALVNDLSVSLKNLSTDYLDMFLVNGDDETTDVSIILGCLDKLKKEGKILNYGCSNWKPYRIRQAMEYAKKHNIDGFTVNQMLWNVGSSNMDESKVSSSYIKMDREMMDIHKEFDILAMPYCALADGFFASLYLNETEPGSVNLEDLKLKSPYYTDGNLKLYDELKAIGVEYIASPSWVALGYLFNQQIETCSILSVKNINQLKEAFEAVDRKYSFDDFRSVDSLREDEVLV